MIDMIEASGTSLEWCIKEVLRKPYIYAAHIAPHDIVQHEFTSGESRLVVARKLGIDFRIAPKLSVEDGIDAVRRLMPRLWIDKRTCAKAWLALQDYHYEFNETTRAFSQRPAHTWSSHLSDSVRYFCVSDPERLDGPQAPVETHAECEWNPFRALDRRNEREWSPFPWTRRQEHENTWQTDHDHTTTMGGR